VAGKFYVIEGGKPDRNGSGGGPEDPMLEARVGRLEDDVREVKSELRDIRGDLRGIHRELGEIKGILQKTPDAKDMWRMVIGTWIAGAGVVALAVRLLG
jgi:hypothetical protein